MTRFLVPVDGSETSLHAVEHLIDKRAWYAPPVEIHLLNVQHPLPGDVSRFVSQQDLTGHHHDEGIRALEAAREKLAAGGFDHAFHISVGDPAHVIAHYARDLHCDQVVMATHGQGAAADALGSVARRVVALAGVPVVLVR
jgi:nucleotide-binding universal stress UspA family protein